MGKPTRDEAEKAVSNMAGTFSGQYVNRGRMDVFSTVSDKINAYQWSAVLDEATCDMCASLDGQVCTPDDPFVSLDIVHSHCRCIWVPIFADDEEQPEATDVPSSIADNFRTIGGMPVVNSFKQLKKPIPQSEKAKQAVANRKG